MIKNKDRFFNFDILKCIAIIMVIFIHIVASELYSYGEISGNRWMTANIIDSFSRMCVPIFVMVSGFFLLRKDEDVKVFFKKRFVKIIPKFFIYSIVFFIFVIIFKDVKNDELFSVFFRKSTYKTIILIFSKKESYHNFFSDFFQGKIYYHLWYIYMILLLYLITPFLRKVVAKVDRKSINYLVYIWIAFIIIIPFLNAVFRKNIKIYSPVGQYIGYFLIGYLLFEKPLNMKKWQKYIIFFIMVFSIIFLTYIFTKSNNKFFDYFYDYHSIGVFGATVLFYDFFVNIFDGEKVFPKVKSIVKSVSAKTYDIYLIHPIFLFFCERILKSRMNYFLYIITAFVIVFALSFFASKALKELFNFVTGINRQFYKKV